MINGRLHEEENKSFKHFLLSNPQNRLKLISSTVIICIQFTVFKYLYPYANFIHGDSFSYINAAANNLDINTYPIGYSKFLRLFSVFNRTDYVLTSFQYLLIEFSALFLLFSFFYFNKIGTIIQYILLIFLICNPLFLHLGNLISSDGLFLALSLIWFALLIWIINRPSTRILVWHSLILFIVFTVRYNAIIYPIISVLAFYLSKTEFKKKIAGLGFAALLIGSFIGFTMFKYKQLTGYWQFSPFSGWQFANNAMFAYRYVDSVNVRPVPKKLKLLDDNIRLFYKNTRNIPIFYSEGAQASTFYMWTQGMPLMYFSNKLSIVAKDKNATEFKKWSIMGPLYKEYGVFIIKQYPKKFIRWFIWPNILKYYTPPVEYLQNYNSGNDRVTKETKNWFGYSSVKISPRFIDRKIKILDPFPILFGTVNIIVFLGIAYYLILKGWKHDHDFSKTIILGSTVWLLNAMFTIVASSAALRFQSFPLVLTTIYSLLLIDWLTQTLLKLKRDLNILKKTDESMAVI